MNLEESRLSTLSNWPANAPIDPREIAKAGFYYLGHNLDVKCFCCGLVLSNWNFNESVMTLHRTFEPTCPFVLNPALSGNEPITRNNDIQISRNSDYNIPSDRVSNGEAYPSITNHQPSSNQDHMYDESARLASFYSWPISFIVTPESLSKAGFYYVQQGDKVKCPYCFVIIRHWETGDDPLEEHRRHSPHCRFLQSSSRPEDDANFSGIIFRESSSSDSDREMKSIGVQTHQVARHPKYTSKDSRLATFNTWSENMTQTPNDFAEAGFYYSGIDDQVRCFHCDGGLRKWEPNDDPWVEHARWFPDCGFIKLHRGEEFIDDSISQHPPILPEVNSPRNLEMFTRSNNTSNSIVAPSNQAVNSSLNHSVPENELEALLNNSIAITALQIGLDCCKVKTAIRLKLEETGSPYSTVDDLVDATLNLQLNDPPFPDPEDTWSTPPNSPMGEKHRSTRQSSQLPTHQIPSQDLSDYSELTPEAPFNQKESNIQKSEKSSAVASCPENVDSNSERKVTMEEEIRRLKEARLCKICMDCEVCIVLLPCGHLVTCVNCAPSLSDCPVCRRSIKATVRTFLS